MSSNKTKYNVCGVIINVNKVDLNALIADLESYEGCEIIEHDGANTIAAVVEDTQGSSAYDKMETIKNNPKVLSITLANHFFDEIDSEQ